MWSIEYAEILKHKKELYSEYRQSKKEMQDLENHFAFCMYKVF